MSTERLSQQDLHPSQSRELCTTKFVSSDNGLAHAYLIPINNDARLAFHGIAELIKQDPTTIPSQCAANLCILPVQTTVHMLSDDDTDTDISGEHKVWDGYYHIRLVKSLSQSQKLMCIVGSGVPRLEDWGVHVLLTLPKNRKTHGVRQRHARFMYEPKPYDNIVIITDEGKEVAVDGRPSTGPCPLMAETTYLDFGSLKYCVRLTAPLEGGLRPQTITQPGVTTPAALTLTPSSSAAMQLVGNYWLGEAIEGGTFGLVSHGRHRHTGERVAVKYGTYRKNAGSRQNEIDVLYHLRNCAQNQGSDLAKHVCNLVEVLHQPGPRVGQVYLIMTPLAEGNMQDLWIQRRPLSIRKAAFRQAVLGVRFVHENGIMHRDLKPTNVVVCEGNPCRAVIVDFGCATFAEESSDHMAGTIGFLAPEIMRLKWWDNATEEDRKQRGALKQFPPYNFKVDVFALGVLGCWLLLGMQVSWKDTAFAPAYLEYYDAMEHFKRPETTSLFELLQAMVDNAPEARPTTQQILAHKAWHEHRD